MSYERMGNWRKTHTCGEISLEQRNEEAILMGWVEDIRDLGGIKFFTLHDSEGMIQITAPEGKVEEEIFEKIDSISKESAVAVKGKITEAEQAPGGVELIPEEIRELNPAKTPLPLDPTGRVKADLDTRLDARLLDLRRPKPSAIFKIKHLALQTFRNYLTSQGFIEINTPKIVGTATETGAILFPISYFEKEAFLSQSPQLYKEVLTGSFEKVFEVGPIFRAEEHDTRYHLNEVLSADIEMAFATKEDVMEVLEDVIVEIFERVKTQASEELEALDHDIEVPEKPLPRLTYEEAIEKLQEKGEEIEWGEDFSIPEQRLLGEIIEEPYFIIDWPTREKPFYIKPHEDNPELSHAFDLLCREIELVSGGTRIHEKDLLKKRLKENGLSPQQFQYHLKNFEWGLPPHAGFGLGVERLLMILTGAKNIRETVLFPRDRKRLKP
ncbi:aspartate--tRNA ligase [candidate division MSBL1 archaeon SCGC-AAA259I09]|uniref:Aspartate--tRNA(Asp/Asn) ligase n=2 Tax=candidate division MSBL1 TaxID=215777 RepID=A0A133US93_9EURY|nr:aspartate--tRNA ligase [candidate division MSBL1 archaeon SCGC-AAA259I09]KXB00791.1 aspartate--tRNA ligase [candidate division MSBL1 archaeon SCGC-AAA259M10]